MEVVHRRGLGVFGAGDQAEQQRLGVDLRQEFLFEQGVQVALGRCHRAGLGEQDRAEQSRGRVEVLVAAHDPGAAWRSRRRVRPSRRRGNPQVDVLFGARGHARDGQWAGCVLLVMCDAATADQRSSWLLRR